MQWTSRTSGNAIDGADASEQLDGVDLVVTGGQSGLVSLLAVDASADGDVQLNRWGVVTEWDVRVPVNRVLVGRPVRHTEGSRPFVNVDVFVASHSHVVSRYLLRLTVQKDESMLACESITRLALTGHRDHVRSLAVDYRTQMLFSGDDRGMIMCWNVEGWSADAVASIDVHTDSVTTLAVHPSDETMLVSGARDGKIVYHFGSDSRKVKRAKKAKGKSGKAVAESHTLAEWQPLAQHAAFSPTLASGVLSPALAWSLDVHGRLATYMLPKTSVENRQLPVAKEQRLVDGPAPVWARHAHERVMVVDTDNVLSLLTPA